MNKERRKTLDKAIALLEEAKSLLEEVASEEQDAFDNMLEGLQQSDKGQAMEEAISELESAFEGVIDAIASAENARGE